MLHRRGWYVREECGHTVIPDDPDFKCSCKNCLELHRAALWRFAGGETMWLTKGDKTDVIIVVVTALVLFAGSC